jgi:propanol-preferring alcohol dehydrogenase
MNACMNTRNRFTPPPTPGSSRGVDGGMADYMLVPSAYVVPIGTVDPAVAAILADAALTSYHSIRSVLPLLLPGTTAVVIGAGGVGHVAVQILKAISAATVVAVDRKDAALDLVRNIADHCLIADDSTVERVLELTARRGAEVILDVVGTDATLAQAAAMVGPYGAIRAIGLGGGQVPFESRWGKTVVPWGVSFTRPYSGTYQDMVDSIALAQTKSISPRVERFALADWTDVFDQLEAGKIRGRAVLVPDMAD